MKISERVRIRFQNGAVQEVKNILSHTKVLPAQLTSTLGFLEIQKYIEGDLSAEQCQKLWAQADFSYSKRQITWWKKYGTVKWFEREDPEWSEKLTTCVLQKISKFTSIA